MLFLVALATAKRIGELQALSRRDSLLADDLVVAYMPHFVAKTEQADAPLPRNFHIRSLRDFTGDLEEGSLLCPVCALRMYLKRTESMVARASPLFVSLRSPSRAMSKNAISYFLWEVISGAGAVKGELTAFVVFPLLLLFCKTGRFPRCWRLQLGNQIQFLPRFF